MEIASYGKSTEIILFSMQVDATWGLCSALWFSAIEREAMVRLLTLAYDAMSSALLLVPVQR